MNPTTSITLSTSPSTLPARKPRLTRRSLYRSTRRRYTGKERDSETGLHYYGARYLDSRTGRWLSGDPAVSEYIPSAPVNEEAKKRNGSLPGMGGVFNYANLHVYHYAGNNPVKYTDPDGRDLRISVSKTNATLTATYTPNQNYDTYEGVNNYNSPVTITIGVVTNVVKNNPDNSIATDTSRTQNSSGKDTNPTQIENGTYNITGAVSPSAGINPSPYYKYGEPGNGLTTDVTQMLPDINTGELVPDTGYMIHITPNSYTDGCIGIPYDSSNSSSRQTAESRMDKIVNMYKIARERGEAATITITD
jgi:RHS repeat-associated protein